MEEKKKPEAKYGAFLGKLAAYSIATCAAICIVAACVWAASRFILWLF